MKISIKVDNLLKTPENNDLRREVEEEVLKLSYFIPQKEFGLKEEDAGEFALEMSSVFDEIFKNYRPESSSFITYLYIILEHGVRKFYKKKKEKQLMESAAVTQYAPPFLTDINAALKTEKSAQRKLSYVLMKRLFYTFTKNADYHRRFFILALSYLPLMEYTSISCICRTFRFNYKETMMLCNTLREKCMKKISRKQSLETRRNTWWTKATAGEFMTASDNNTGIEMYKDWFMSRVKDLEKFSPKVPYRMIAEVLGMTEKTTSTISRDMRTYLLWLFDGCKQLPDSVLSRKTIPRRLYWDMRNEKWKEPFSNWDMLPELLPSSAFICSVFTEQAK